MYDVLDKTRDCASLHPPIETSSGILAFKQNGRYFDHNGRRVRTAEDAPDPVVKPAKVSKMVAADVPSAGIEPVGETMVGDLNLSAWADHKVNYRFALIRQAIQDRYHLVVKDEFEARDFLAGKGIGAAPPERKSIFDQPITEVEPTDDDETPPPLV